MTTIIVTASKNPAVQQAAIKLFKEINSSKSGKKAKKKAKKKFKHIVRKAF
jgi:hypothetical protein